MGYNMGNPITSVEFGVCARDHEGNETLGLLSVDKGVQKILCEMLSTTRSMLGLSNPDYKLERYEPAQQYQERETLWMPMDDVNLEKIYIFYHQKNINTDPSLLNNINKLFFYFAIFHLKNGNKVVGVRRTAQFKGIVSAKGRLIKLVDDSLKITNDDIFKLDHNFDFLIRKSKVLILSPSSLSQIADLDKYIKKTAASALKSMSKELTFASFDSSIKYVSTHIRCAKLVASLRARNDLHLISKQLFIKRCEENSIQYETNADGTISPQKGQELAFLQLLDRRRFTTELIQDIPERYEAPNRRGVS